MDTKIVSTITSHGPGYLDQDLEQIVGFQTDKPFKRSFILWWNSYGQTALKHMVMNKIKN